MTGHKKLHEEEHRSGGDDEIPEGSLLPQDPTPHADEHVSGGSDEMTGIDAGQLASGVLNNSELEMLDGVNTASELVTKDVLDSHTQGIDWQESVLKDDVSDPSSLTPEEGDRYLVPTNAEGDWSGHEDEIAEYDGSDWNYHVPDDGTAVWIESDNVQKNYNGSEWVLFGSTTEHGVLSGLGNDDHTQYLLADGGRNLSGNLEPDENNSRKLGAFGNQWSSVYTFNVESFGALYIEGDPLTIGAFDLDGTIECDNNDISNVNNVDVKGTLDASGAKTMLSVIDQSSEPSLGTGEIAVWEDTDNGDIWLVQNVDGTQYKVQLT